MQASARLSSSAASKKVIAGATSAITRSCYRASRGKAHAAPLSAQEPPPKGQKRITKQERRVRIVEFVDKFRASNDGKFPSIKNVRREAGGSHYTVREILQELKYNHMRFPLGNVTAAPLQGTAEVAEQGDEAMVDQLQGTPEFAEQSRPKDDSVKNPCNFDSSKSSKEIQDVDVLSQKDAATSTGIVEKTETWKSVADGPTSKYNLSTSETFNAADGPTLSDQTENERMKIESNKSSVYLGVEAKSDSGNQQRETEAIKFSLKNTEKVPSASESIVSDQSGSDKVTEAIHDRECDPKHEPEESTSTGLFGSLKSFAYGIRSFWKKL